ncbi:multiple sugar transport system substrate-binding protein [Bacillus sp. SORGH_AS 510]|uniref:ABC transporter substrate-binding protein n=1 Tax=Bacillus sp. SORGH_AS_0510 TaxID=3041771 RepID=UPI00277FE6AC|nr:sugar ABC transporter substrate-binding protein [Bacillus sp. SORGH_AS_0510]MDQ1143938.1 multiple sugar transport system substrate-binding protein [Bacillus sp. SORGH_AS_0510]
MMKITRLKFILFFVLSVALVLSGCSSSVSDTKDQNESKDGKVTIRFATWDSEETLDLQKKMVEEYNAKNDKVKVVLEAYGADFDTKIAAGMGAKDAPDVMYMWNYPSYKDALEPLDSYIKKEGADYKDNFYDALWNYNKADGKVLGLPVGYTTHVVYYNKKLFDEKGVEYPKAGWTWNDLQETAKKLTDKEKKITGFAFSGKPDPYDFEMYLWSNGASYVDKKGNLEGHVNSKKSIEVFHMFQNMLKEGSAITTEGSGSTEMKSGKVAMFVNGAWSLGTLKEAGIDYGIVELPKFKGGKNVSIVSSSGIAMSKDSKHKKAAFEFMKYWTGEEANKARIEYELPVLKSVVEKEKIGEDPVKSVFYSMLEKSNGYTPASFIVEDWSTVSENLNLVFEQIFNPSTLMDPKKALNEAAQ